MLDWQSLHYARFDFKCRNTEITLIGAATRA
jgi:hypothetical protein